MPTVKDNSWRPVLDNPPAKAEDFEVLADGWTGEPPIIWPEPDPDFPSYKIKPGDWKTPSFETGTAGSATTTFPSQTVYWIPFDSMEPLPIDKVSARNVAVANDSGSEMKLVWKLALHEADLNAEPGAALGPTKDLVWGPTGTAFNYFVDNWGFTLPDGLSYIRCEMQGYRKIVRDDGSSDMVLHPFFHFPHYGVPNLGTVQNTETAEEAYLYTIGSAGRSLHCPHLLLRVGSA